MRCIAHLALWLAMLTINAPAAAGAASATFATTGTPAGFDGLASARVSLVDVYFGERKVGETLAVTEPGTLQFRAPADVLAMLPQVVAAPALKLELAADLSTNTHLACSVSNVSSCGFLDPQIVGIIYDEERFRVQLFVNPRFQRILRSSPQGYLPTPNSPLSLTNALGFNASGPIGGRSAYNLQNRTIIALRDARLRANTSLGSNLGLVVDDLVGEVDRRNLRYSAGLFWTPGNEFTGQRRVLGAGVGTQFDTSADRDTLHGTPLILFLPQPARIELLVDGRLVSSGFYRAGNNEFDTSALSAGSYSIVLRIHESNGRVREERRFFVRNAQVPPMGRPMFHAYVGALANTRRHQPISPSGPLYYQAAAAWRLTNSLAVDAAVLGTQDKAIVEAGAWFISGPARVRAAALVSSAGDKGGLLQMTTAGGGPLSISFDLRRIWSRDGRPLIPLSSRVDTFGVSPPTGVQLANGSYTQATGSVGLRIGGAQLTVVGSYRKDRDSPVDYSIGPSVSWPVVTRNQLQVVLEGSAQRTRSTTAGFAGVRLFYSSGRMSVLSTVGGAVQHARDHSGPSASRAVTSLAAQFSHETEGGTIVNVEGGVDHNIDSSILRTGGTLKSSFGNARADLLHNLEGSGGTQYNVAFQSGFAVGADASAWGARTAEQSAIVVSVDGDAADTVFDVLIDDVARGRVRVGQRLSLFVPGYRTYRVRLVPAAASAVSYDSAERAVTLYPGNLKVLEWRAESYFAVFGQAMSASGTPISNALVQTKKSIAETDSNGYFQIDVRKGDQISIAKTGEALCHVTLGDVRVKNDLASVGEVTCQ